MPGLLEPDRVPPGELDPDPCHFERAVGCTVRTRELVPDRVPDLDPYLLCRITVSGGGAPGAIGGSGGGLLPMLRVITSRYPAGLIGFYGHDPPLYFLGSVSLPQAQPGREPAVDLSCKGTATDPGERPPLVPERLLKPAREAVDQPDLVGQTATLDLGPQPVLQVPDPPGV